MFWFIIICVFWINIEVCARLKLVAMIYTIKMKYVKIMKRDDNNNFEKSNFISYLRYFMETKWKLTFVVI